MPSSETSDHQVGLIMKHEQFLPLSSPGGDGRNDIALINIQTWSGGSGGAGGIQFDQFVSPACLPHSGIKLKR